MADSIDMKPIDDLIDKISKSRLPPRHVRRNLRTRLSLSQEELAEAIGVTPQTIALWEKGTNPARFDYREKYLYFLHKASDLLGEVWEGHFEDD